MIVTDCIANLASFNLSYISTENLCSLKQLILIKIQNQWQFMNTCICINFDLQRKFQRGVNKNVLDSLKTLRTLEHHTKEVRFTGGLHVLYQETGQGIHLCLLVSFVTPTGRFWTHRGHLWSRHRALSSVFILQTQGQR